MIYKLSVSKVCFEVMRWRSLPLLLCVRVFVLEREIGGREEGEWRELESNLGPFVKESRMKGAGVFQWSQTHKQNLMETEK